jgi:hypothetical protein
MEFRLQSFHEIHRGSSKYWPNPSISVGRGAVNLHNCGWCHHLGVEGCAASIRFCAKRGHSVMVIFPVSLDTYPEVKTSAASLPYRSRELALQLDQRVVGAENLSSGVVVMKSAQDGK